MNIRFCLVFLVLVCGVSWCLSCAPDIPTAEYPAQIENVFPRSFDDVWEAVLGVVGTSAGTLITTDKPGGIIVYSIFDQESKSQLYMNVFLKRRTDSIATVVYLIPRFRFGRPLRTVDRDFFKTLEETLEKR
jgi:hypothetical protein